MALTRPKIWDLDTNIEYFMDPITVLHQGATSANVDVGFLFNRANGLVSNVAVYWSESGQSIQYVFTSNTGVTNSNITPTGYANVTVGNVLFVNGAGLYINGSLGTNGQVLSSTGSGLQWVASGGFSGGSVPNQTTFASNIVASAGTASTSSTTGALVVVGGIGTSGNVWAGQVYSTNNGNGTNFAVGDDTWIGDINIANTMGIKGQQDPTQGYIVFGNANNTNYIGRSGSNPITVTGAFSVTGTTTLSTASFSGVTTHTANIVAASGTSSTNTTTGALVVTGGAGISGDLNVGGNVVVNGAPLYTNTVTSIGTGASLIDSWASATWRAARYHVTITNVTNSKYQISEISVLQDGATPTINQYGTIYSVGTTQLVTFSANIVSGNTMIWGTGVSSSNKVTFTRVLHSI